MTADTETTELTGQIAIITGAAQGLGLATVATLGARGAHVILADRQGDRVAQEAESLQAQGLSVGAAELDVTDSTAVATMFEATAKEYGSLDILVTCAGVGQQVGPVSELDDTEWNRVLDVTLHGVFYCCRAAAAIMEPQESGNIVNFASINGQNPAALVAAYNVAKAGVISLTRTMAQELAAYGVRVNAVAPGPVYTEFNQRNMAQRAESLNVSVEEMMERVRKAVPLGRWGEPEDIAGAVAYLCSPAASWVTGEVLRVSGGMEGVSAAAPKRTLS
ncbi:MAG: glucose 1-dehydrogenase [Candidatus Latescibacterota bacterium]|nr:glucose 1-dehydrogenase [Candidatus Latescibacterota bacterium]